MASAADGRAKPAGLDALHRLKSTEPPLYLTSSPELSKSARLALEYLFASLNPYAPKSPFRNLLTEGFDAEQIWQQIDLQAQPLLSSVRRQVRNFEKNPLEIEKQFNLDRDSGKGEITKRKDSVESESEDFDVADEEEEEVEDEDEEGVEEEGEENDDENDEDMDNEEAENVNGVEDKFLKIKELEEYLVEDEAREYGLKKDQKKKNKTKRVEISDEDEEDEDEEGDEDEDGEDEDDELGLMELEDDDGSDMDNARYQDFFTSTKRTSLKKKPKYDDESNDMDMDELDNDDGNQNEQRLGQLRAKAEEMEKANMQGKTKQNLSTHEKELEKLRAEIEEMERANMEPKSWTMQGEVTAAKRPKNSALEADLDFEHNVRPVPVQTEEGTKSLEELILKRIVEGQFDDVQKPPTLLTKAPREKKELDENKSKKGLAELYEDEYAQKTGLVSAALSFSDEQKKEANMLFKKLCVKLDALSHFHFAPKPVIEDMSIQANVPALAMEEVAPLAVSDAAMLAPEEVFSGKGGIKEETELTKADRKRRRAKKKRQFKAKSVEGMAVKAQLSTSKKPDNVAGNGSHE